jgi:hypothetical protein
MKKENSLKIDIKNEDELQAKKSSLTTSKSKKKHSVKKTLTKATSELKVKEKKNSTVNDEIIFCIENNLQITISLLSKRVGVSTHRIRKYCKANFIDLDKINKNNYKLMLDPKRVKDIKKQEKLATEQKKLDDEEKKRAEKLKKSLSKKNQTSSKHKMPIDTTNNDKLLLNCSNTKIKLF